jgi:alpha-glucoside transport system substrate-binding protein
MHSVWFKRSLLLSLVAMFTVVACGGGGTQSAGTVKVMATWTGDEQASFLAVMKPFTDSTGIKIEYEASRDQDALLTTRVAAGNPPDLAAAPSPTLLTNFAKQGKVIALNSIVDMTKLKAENAKTWLDLGAPTGDGKLYQIYSWVSLKGLIWYNPKNFQSKSYSIPSTWDGLIGLQSQIKSGGTTPWCIGLESGAASGWPGSDWVKEIVLSQAGPTVYDNWWQGKQKWTSPEIKAAWQSWGTILGPMTATSTVAPSPWLRPASPTPARPCSRPRPSATCTTRLRSSRPSSRVPTHPSWPEPTTTSSRCLTSPLSTPVHTWSRATHGRCSTTRRRLGR